MTTTEMILHRHLTANARGHTRGMGRTIKAIREEVAWIWIAKGKPTPPPGVPVTITLRREAVRRLDSHDNLRTAFKPVVDELVKCLGMRDDSDRNDLLDLVYDQKSGPGVLSQAVIVLEWVDA